MITLTVKLAGDFSSGEKLEAQYIVGLENKRRAELETPEPALPTGTDPELLVSYESVLTIYFSLARESYQSHAVSVEVLKNKITEDDFKEITTAIITRLNAGETASAIIDDVK